MSKNLLKKIGLKKFLSTSVLVFFVVFSTEGELLSPSNTDNLRLIALTGNENKTE